MRTCPESTEHTTESSVGFSPECMPRDNLEILCHSGGPEKGVDRKVSGLALTAVQFHSLDRTGVWRVYYLLFWKLCKSTVLWAELAAGHSPVPIARALPEACPLEKYYFLDPRAACSASVECGWPQNCLCSKTQYLEPRLPSSSSADERLFEALSR